MADFRSRITTSEHLLVRGVAAAKGASPSAGTGSGPWDGAGGLDQITVVRIDDSHIAGEQAAGGKAKEDGVGYYEMEYSLPAEGEEEEEEEEEEEDGVYVIEYSNPEEEGESYQFTMSVDRSQPAKKPLAKHPAGGEHVATATAATLKPSRPTRQKLKRKPGASEEEEEEEERREAKKEAAAAAALGGDYGEAARSGKRPLVCGLCPPPGKFFKRASGLAVHLKQMHQMVGKKTFFCPSCKQTLRTQLELDAHTRRHANQVAVFTCLLCPGPAAGYAGSRMGLKRHLEAEHPGVVPRCDVCDKGFKTLASYLSDQFRHVGVSPYYCPRCKIYEMTERGLSVHLKNHDKRQKLLEAADKQPLAHGLNASADNSATDDSDF